MDIVMVPVPEELVGAVERFLMIKGMMGRGVAVNRDSVAAVLPTLDARCRQVLLAVADTKLSEGDMAVTLLARSLGWSIHETVGVAYELAELLLAAFGPTVMLASLLPPESDVDAVDWENRVVHISLEVAHAIVEAERLVSGVEE
jgi:hypothetical protein